MAKKTVKKSKLVHVDEIPEMVQTTEEPRIIIPFLDGGRIILPVGATVNLNGSIYLADGNPVNLGQEIRAWRNAQ